MSFIIIYAIQMRVVEETILGRKLKISVIIASYERDR
jgi:hypothetical protein